MERSQERSGGEGRALTPIGRPPGQVQVWRRVGVGGGPRDDRLPAGRAPRAGRAAAQALGSPRQELMRGINKSSVSLPSDFQSCWNGIIKRN